MIIYQKFIYRTDMQANPEVRYLWGDNELRKGVGGQAKEMRGEPNGIGIRTKKAPGFDDRDLWHDKDYYRQKKLLDEDFLKAIDAINQNRVIIVPYEGIGTGFARLKDNAPKTLRYIEKWIDVLKEYKNGGPVKFED